MRTNSSAFERLANVVTIREIQRRFAFQWDVDRDGNSELDLLAKYHKCRGLLQPQPVLLTGTYTVENLSHTGTSLPCAVYFPEEALAACFQDGTFDVSKLQSEENEGISLDEGVCFRTVELTPGAVVSADMTMLDFLAKPPPAFQNCGAIVLDGSNWTGVMTVDELMSAPAKMCLLALTLELEKAAADLCRLFPIECFFALSEGRRKKATDTLKDRFGYQKSPEKAAACIQQLSLYAGNRYVTNDGALISGVFSLALDHTCLTDKGTMVCKCKLSINVSNTRIKSVFERAEDLRNNCAHTGVNSECLPSSFADLVTLVHDIAEMVTVFRDSFDAESRVRNTTPAALLK